MRIDGARPRWDPLGELPTRNVLQIWNGTLAFLHGLSIVGFALRDDWTSAAYVIITAVSFTIPVLARAGALLAREILHEFWQQPLLWDPARREAAGRVSIPVGDT